MVIPMKSSVHFPEWALRLSLIFLVGFLYLVSNRYSEEVNVDSEAASLHAWHIVTGEQIPGSFIQSNPWLFEAQGEQWSNRALGLIVFALPSYWLFPSKVPSVLPGSYTALLFTLAGLFVCFLLLRKYLSVKEATFAIVLLAFGTSHWNFSSMELWPHAPTFFFVSVFVFSLVSKANILVLAFSVAGIFACRPFLALFVTFLSLGLLFSEQYKQGKELLALLCFFAISFVLSEAFRFEDLHFIQRYSPDIALALVEMPLHQQVVEFLKYFFSPHHGLLIWSPCLLPLLFGGCRALRFASWKERLLMFAAVLTIFVQVRFSQVSGNLAFNYRYPLDVLPAFLPLLSLCYLHWVKKMRIRLLSFLVASALAIFLQGLYHFNFRCDDESDATTIVEDLRFKDSNTITYTLNQPEISCVYEKL